MKNNLKESIIKNYKPFIINLIDSFINKIEFVTLDDNHSSHNGFCISYKNHVIFIRRRDEYYWYNIDLDEKLEFSSYEDLTFRIEGLILKRQKYEEDQIIVKFNQSLSGFIKKFGELKLKMPITQEGQLSVIDQEE